MPAAAHHPTEFVRALTARFLADPRVEGLWLEAADDSIQWPPYRVLDVHFAVPEPHVDSLRRELLGIFQALDAVRDFGQQQAPLKGFAGTARLSDGTPLTYRIERTSQIAKVPRHGLNLLLDRSGGLLLPALSFAPR